MRNAGYLLFPIILSRSIGLKIFHPSFKVLYRKMSYMIDFDANLLHKDLIEKKLELVKAAKDSGVKVFVVPGTDLEDSEAVLDFQTNTSHDTNIISTCGIHPYNAESVQFNEISKHRLESLVQDSRCYAVGECGLDYSPGFPHKAFQIEWFKFQVSLALRQDKPLYFHIRDAEEDFIDIINECDLNFDAASPPKVPCVVHCFTGHIEELSKYIQRGFYIGLTGYIFNLPDDKLAEMLQIITLDRLVIETDAPYMGFPGCRGLAAKKRSQKYPNIPSALVQIVDRISTVSSWEKALIVKSTTKNALEVLRVHETTLKL